MQTFVLLFWLVIGADDKTQLFITPEATIEQCQKDGDLFRAESEADVQTKDIKYFYGACLPVDTKDIAASLGMDKRGSI